MPIPLAPPCISIVSFFLSDPESNKFVHTVKKVSGIAAASTTFNPLGIGSIVASVVLTYSAYPPPVTNAQTSLPLKSKSIFLPISTILPDTSSPKISDAPLGGG